MIYTDIIQGTDEWKRVRAGKVTGSRISDVLAKGRGNSESTTRRNYMAQVAVEILTGEPMMETYSNGHMNRGNELEPSAREVYEFITGYDVQQIGFIDHERISHYGVSPDGLVGEEGLMQIKSPIPAIHIDYLLAGTVPTQYVKQMQAEMDCTGRAWNDFVSYCPALPEELQLFIVRCERDEEMISTIRAGVEKFLSEVDGLVSRLREKALQGAA